MWWVTPGLYNALYQAGITINDVDPDYVIIGETVNYNFDTISRAMYHVNNGAKLIGTNTDLTGPSDNGLNSCVPGACGAHKEG